MKIKNEKGSVISRIFKDNKYCWLAFGCSAVIMLIVYICYSLIPFGDVTILRMDLYHQYGPLFAEFYDRVTQMKSFLYSWNTGLGGSFLSVQPAFDSHAHLRPQEYARGDSDNDSSRCGVFERDLLLLSQKIVRRAFAHNRSVRCALFFLWLLYSLLLESDVARRHGSVPADDSRH